MPESARTDHDHIIMLDGRITTVERRINGHVPDSCIRTDEMLQQITKDVAEIKGGIVWLWRTVGSAAIVAIIGLLLSRITH